MAAGDRHLELRETGAILPQPCRCSLVLPPQEEATGRLRYWQHEPTLEEVRYKEKLDELPADVARSWRALWQEVESLLARAKAREDGSDR